MKKLTAVVLVLSIIFLNASSVFAQAQNEHAQFEHAEPYLTRVSAVEEIVKTLYLSGGDTNFTFEDYYCLHPGNGGSAHFVPDEALLQSGYPLLCEIYTSVEDSQFADISEENLSIYISIAKEMGIVNGFEDNTFRPERYVTWNEAVKMLVCVFGLSASAETLGGYPEGYIAVAKEEGITQGLDFNGNDTVTEADFYVMLAAALENWSSNPQIGVFVPPLTPEESARLYAEAVKSRNGALQFALYDDELKEQTRDDFLAFNWVTGVSSPWVSGFEINRASDLKYEIIFHYATSTGPSNDMTARVTLADINGVYKITHIEYEHEE